MKSIVFAKRTLKEMGRDPLSYMFCLGFPLVMLIIMTILNKNIPKEAGMTIFQIQNLAPGIAVFGLTFVMLFTTLQTSKDRTTALLLRLYASPMKSSDYVIGYTLPVIIISIAQSLITFAVAIIIGLVTDYSFDIKNVLLCVLVLLPSAFLFIGLGIFFGTILNDKAAPGISSIIITLSSMLGGIWMDVDAMSNGFAKVCHALPFYQGTKVARLAITGQYSEMGQPLLMIGAYGIGIYLLAVFFFRRKMQSDQK